MDRFQSALMAPGKLASTSQELMLDRLLELPSSSLTLPSPARRCGR